MPEQTDNASRPDPAAFMDRVDELLGEACASAEKLVKTFANGVREAASRHSVDILHEDGDGGPLDELEQRAADEMISALEVYITDLRDTAEGSD